METKNLKALSIQRLQGNQQGNFKETKGVYQGNFEETGKGNFDLDRMEHEYFTLLARFWSIDDTPPGISDEEADHVLARLDILFRELTRQGRKVPVRLPIERQRKVA